MARSFNFNFKKSKIIPNEVTSGLDTVAVRMPKNNIAYALISQSKTPIAAPSANLSGKPSPTAARHVFEDLNQKIDLILDGGKTKVGLESTVLDLTSEIPTILRPGKVTFEQIKKVIGNVNLSEAILSKKEIIESVKSPGMKYKHYSPKADLILIKGSTEKVRKKIEEIVLKNKSKKIGILTQDKNFKIKNCIIKFAGKNHLEISNRLFSNLRFFDSKKVDLILVESVNEKGLGLAIMNRLIRAAYKITNV